MNYKAKENYTESAKMLTKAIEAAPDNTSYKIELANVQYLRRAYFEAIPAYEEILSQDEDNVLYLARLSEMYSMSPQKMKSADYAERALKLKPNNGEINKILARSFLEVKHYPRAIKLYQQAEASLPDDIDIPYKIAECYVQIQDYTNANTYFHKALNLDPDNATKIYEAANASFEAGAFQRAIDFYQLAEDKGYFKTTTFYSNWAAACLDLKDYNKALFYYSKAKELAPYDREIGLSIAETYTSMGEYSKCRDVLDALLEINPNDAEVIYTKGMSYYKSGSTGKAEHYFNKAFELDPSLRNLRYVKSNF
jgi:tetratricopeptide (TPR) repeat protein